MIIIIIMEKAHKNDDVTCVKHWERKKENEKNSNMNQNK